MLHLYNSSLMWQHHNIKFKGKKQIKNNMYIMNSRHGESAKATIRIQMVVFPHWMGTKKANFNFLQKLLLQLKFKRHIYFFFETSKYSLHVGKKVHLFLISLFLLGEIISGKIHDAIDSEVFITAVFIIVNTSNKLNDQ